MSLQSTNDEQKVRIAARLRELNADREDLKRQRQLCMDDIARCDRELSRPTFREHAETVKEQRRESGAAIQVIDAELTRIKGELHALNCLVNNTLDDYFMDEARKVLPREAFESIRSKASEARNAHLAFLTITEPIHARA